MIVSWEFVLWYLHFRLGFIFEEHIFTFGPTEALVDAEEFVILRKHPNNIIQDRSIYFLTRLSVLSTNLIPP